MKKLFLFVLPLFLFLSTTTFVRAASDATPGLINGFICGINSTLSPVDFNVSDVPDDPCIQDRLSTVPQNQFAFLGGKLPSPDSLGYVHSPGVLGGQGQFISMLFNNQISGQEYVADVLNNIGIPSISHAYAQNTGGTGYSAMKPFLELWKVFRNLAYSLYIIMFVVIGVMIMLRTKVNAQTIISIQTALPNLLITLILITFSYAIVGFMIDLMYFLIYFVVYLISTTGIIDASRSITRLMSYSAWSVIFAGRNSIISAVSMSITGVLGSLGTGGIGLIGNVARGLNATVRALTFGLVSPIYLFIAISFAIAMLKLMITLIKSYVMLIIQTVTAPVQILMNAMPGSKAFSQWLKTTASYLLPFPVVACMFIFSAILVGNPANKTIWGRIITSIDPNAPNTTLSADNPFGVNNNAELYQNRDKMWLPPFTLTDSLTGNADPKSADVLTLIGFFVFLMTPSAAKMAQEWLQVKESPYAAEALKGFGGVVSTGVGYPMGWFKQARSLQEQRSVQEYGARKYAEEAAKLQKEQQTSAGKNLG